MRASENRLLTTHMGSLPRPEPLADLLVAREQGETIDEAAFERQAGEAIDAVVRAQIGAGIDVINDGELPRASFHGYVSRRMSGFGGQSERPPTLEMRHFPKYMELMRRRQVRRIDVYKLPAAIGEVRYEDLSGAEQECRAFRQALEASAGGWAEAFMTAVSPGFCATSLMNQHYDSHEAYVFALARELKKEYELIVQAGFLLQIDSPDFGIERSGYFQNESLKDFQAAMEMHVAALNLALENVPADRVRLHACWGNRDGPHLFDVACADVLGIIYQARVGAICLPFANPRHAHEVEVFREQPLPDGMLLVSGAIETTHNYVEHPQVVAERLERAVGAVGERARVIAGTDCGFGTVAGDAYVAEDVVWPKLESLVAGAAIASKRLWG